MKLQRGENRLRILSKPIIGYEYWNLENKPVRLKGKDKPVVALELIKVDAQGNRNLKHFWALVVWNYAENAIQILEITQQSVQSAIEAYSKDDLPTIVKN